MSRDGAVVIGGAQTHGAASPPVDRFSFSYTFGGVWLAYAGYGILLAVLPLAELAEGGGPLLATLVVGAPLLAQTVSSWGWGWLADRTGARRVPLVVAMLLQVPLFAVFPVLDAAGLFAVRIVQSGLFGAVVLATTQATEDRSASAAFRLGRLQLAQNAGMLLGVIVAIPILLGNGFHLASAAGWELVVLLGSFSGLSAVIFGLAGDSAIARQPAAPAQFTPTTNPGVFGLAGATTAVSSVRYIAVTAIPVYLASSLGNHGLFGIPANTTVQLAVWVAVSSTLNLLASPFSGRWAETSQTRRRSLLAFALVYSVIWTAIAVSPTYPVVFAVWSLPVAVFFTVAGVREAAFLSAPSQRGRAVGLLTAAFNLGGLVGGVVAGVLLARAVPVQTVFVVAAVGSLLAALLFLPGILRRSEPSGPAPETGPGPSPSQK